MMYKLHSYYEFDQRSSSADIVSIRRNASIRPDPESLLDGFVSSSVGLFFAF